MNDVDNTNASEIAEHMPTLTESVDGHFEKIRSHIIPRILELENPRDRWIAAELEMWESSLALLLQEEGLKVDYGPRLVTEEMQRSWERDRTGDAPGA
jgi:hypothetical protein